MIHRLSLAIALLAGALHGQDFDILIRNGVLADGTGNAAYRGDVGIRGGRISAVGNLTGRKAARTIDAAGLVVAPGFIDMHNHSDDTLLQDGNAESAVRQGITSMILGEGLSAAPTPKFPTFKAYYGELLKRGVSLNVGSYIGSGQVWINIHGSKEGPATKQEVDKMRTQVREAMQNGALGVASSLNFPPGIWIDTDTMVAMCEVASEFGGVYSTHIRTEGTGVFEAVGEAIEISRRAKLPVDIIHLKIANQKLWGQMPELIASIAAARARGEQVEAQIYPYTAGQNRLLNVLPPWAQEGDLATVKRRLKDPAVRQRLDREILNGLPGWFSLYEATGGWQGMMVVSLSNPAYKKFEGKRMNEVIQAMGKPGVEVLLDLIDSDAEGVPALYFHHSEPDMQFALKQPWVSIGSDGTAVKAEGPLSAGKPHPRYYGTFPRVLGRYVREQKVLTLEDAVRKITSANANKARQFDRGLLRPGFWGDVTIFNPNTVIDNATYENPHQYPTGIEYVIVNGKVVVDRGKHTGARPGAILYGQGLVK